MSAVGSFYSMVRGDQWKNESGESVLQSRRGTVLMVLVTATVFLLGRACYLQLVQRDFLQGEGLDRYQRLVTIPANRGMILDRNGEPLAISTPVESIWVNPRELLKSQKRLPELAKALGMEHADLLKRLKQRADRQFLYVRRHLDPDDAERVSNLGIRGVYTQREYRRYYPTGEVSAHLLGFADIDHHGQEGLELAYEGLLSGEAGSRRVIRDLQNRVVEGVGQIKAPVHGENLVLSLDQRLQYLAYRELKAAIAEHGAESGSVVIIDPRNGEVLAIVNQPSYNPNSRRNLKSDFFRNRAVTDVFEPGSTMKPFTVAAALEGGYVKPETVIDTGGGSIRMGRYTINDVHAYGLLNVSGVIKKSSNVGATKIAFSMPAVDFGRLLKGVGFGQSTGAGFPGEVNGVLRDAKTWKDVERATISFGYGMNATALQLAQAYATFANGGVRHNARFVAGRSDEGVRAMSAKTAGQVLAMMETVTSDEGTAAKARVEGYRVAGKTGTSHKNKAGSKGYEASDYLSLFVGLAPVSDPRLVMAIMINEPRRGGYYGGQVAAPVFSRVMSGALRLLDIKPDNLPLLQAQNPPAKAGST
jgi:cell division protein FtsI (penicillin-binding protein 3)